MTLVLGTADQLRAMKVGGAGRPFEELRAAGDPR
jgi:hypothetical protein